MACDPGRTVNGVPIWREAPSTASDAYSRGFTCTSACIEVAAEVVCCTGDLFSTDAEGTVVFGNDASARLSLEAGETEIAFSFTAGVVVGVADSFIGSVAF